VSYVAAVDLGGTKILGGVFEVPREAGAIPDAVGRLAMREAVARRKEDTRPEEGPERVIERMAALVESLAEEAGVGPAGLSAVGVASPGPLDPDTGVVVHAPNLGWRHVPLAGRIEARLGVPVRVDHDCALAALAEWSVRRARGRAPDPLVYVTVGTGIGAGIIIGGRVFHGHRGAAGEVGHLTVLASGPRCRCGNRGCLEALASGAALARDADGGRPDAARASRAARWVGLGLASVAAVLDPEVIVIGGGVALGLGSSFLETVKHELRSRLMPAAWGGAVPAVEPPVLGEDSGLVGAALAAYGAAGVGRGRG